MDAQANSKPKAESTNQQTNLLTPKIEPGIVPPQRVTSFSTRPSTFRSSNGSTSSAYKYINKYKPNVNVKREKCEALTLGRSNRAYNSGRGKESKRGTRGRGRGDLKNKVVQGGLTPWSSGICDSSRSSRSFSGGRSGSGGGGRGGYGGGGGGGLVKASSSRVTSEDGYKIPVLNDEGIAGDIDHDDEILKRLADGDFIDHGEYDNAEYYNHFVQPITLAQYTDPPAVKEVKLQLESCDLVKKKLPEGNGVESAEEGKVVANGNVKVEVKTEEETKSPTSVDTLADLLGKEGAFFVQLPNPLPFKADLSARPSKDSKQSTNAYTQESEFCHLKDLKPGKIGSVKVFKSGRACLCIGGYNFPIHLLKQPNHVEEVAHVDVSENSGKLSILSQIESRLIISPDFGALVNSPDKKA